MTTDQVPTAPVDGLRSPQAAACFASYEVAFAYLFGSHARGDARGGSDVDVAVRHATAGAASTDVRVELAADLAVATGLARVEVVALDERRLPLLCRVLRERVVVYSADEVARVRFESRQWRICADFMRRAARLDRELLAGHAESRRLMVDEGRVRRLLDRIASETEALRASAAEHDDATLLAHADLLSAVKYRFVVVIEAAVDVGEHLIAAEQLRAPESYADVFRVLGEHGWLSDDLASQLQRMAGFRNVLVHAYQDVDDHHVIAVQRTRLADLDGFRREIATGLTGNEPEEPLGP